MGGPSIKKLFPCKHCGTPFMATDCDYRRGAKKYCSRECYRATRPRIAVADGGKTNFQRKRETAKRHPVKAAAWLGLERAVRSGRLKRWPCVICSDPKSDGHHYDYARPLEVYWLCRKHHVEAHEGRILLPTDGEPEIPAHKWPRGRRCRQRWQETVKLTD
jgi:hypothetical protein